VALAGLVAEQISAQASAEDRSQRKPADVAGASANSSVARMAIHVDEKRCFCIRDMAGMIPSDDSTQGRLRAGTEH